MKIDATDTVIRAGFDELTARKVLKIMWLPTLIISSALFMGSDNIGLLCSAVLVFIFIFLPATMGYCNSKTDLTGKLFVFKPTGVYISRSCEPQAIVEAKEPMLYSEFSNVFYDYDTTLLLKTKSGRIQLKTKLLWFSKNQTEQLLHEFQKRGKKVSVAIELSGVYDF